LTLGLLLLGVCAVSPAPTFLPAKMADSRKVVVTRKYEIKVVRGKKNVADIPAIMSFWGATNDQVVLDSNFTYSLKPDKVGIAADDRGTPRRYYELTWEAPQADSITVTQSLLVEVSCRNLLSTAAKMPYPKEVQDFYATSLAKDAEINPDNPKIAEIVKGILAKSRYAEDAIELACDHVCENVKFQSGAAQMSDKILADGKGNCVGMAKLACAILRKAGIPAERVPGSFIGSTNGHEYIEAYLPDAGWVFYDLSNANRGFKCPDVLMTTGWSYRIGDGASDKWVQGDFLESKDAAPYKEPGPSANSKVREAPKGMTVEGVKVVYQAPPASAKVRHLPLSRLLLDMSVDPGKRDYKASPAPWAQTQPAAAPASRPAATPGATPKSSPA
jgi:hypothetical protein